jgi:hypothetical protein
MSAVYKTFLEKLGGSDPTQFIGRYGDIFFDPNTGALRISDGSTPGGILLGALGSTGYAGSFYSTSIQLNNPASTARAMVYNGTDISDGVQIVNSSRIKILHAGNYNIQFSAQLDKTDSNDDAVDIWLRKNQNDISWSNTRFLVQGNNGKHVASWNWVVSALVDDYFEIMWSSTDANMRIYSQGESINPTRPGIPSIILTVCQV